MNTTTKYKDADEAYEAGNKWISESTKWDKLQLMRDTCSSEFLHESLLDELAKFVTESEFNEFFEHLRRNWDIKTPQELDYATNS